MGRNATLRFRATNDEAQIVEALREKVGAKNISETLRILVQSGARAYGLDKPRPRLRRLTLPTDPPKAA